MKKKQKERNKEAKKEESKSLVAASMHEDSHRILLYIISTWQKGNSYLY